MKFRCNRKNIDVITNGSQQESRSLPSLDTSLIFSQCIRSIFFNFSALSGRPLTNTVGGTVVSRATGSERDRNRRASSSSNSGGSPPRVDWRFWLRSCTKEYWDGRFVWTILDASMSMLHRWPYQSNCRCSLTRSCLTYKIIIGNMDSRVYMNRSTWPAVDVALCAAGWK